MKVMLVSINKLKSYRPVLPIGMVTIASQAQHAGHQVRCLDLMFEDDDEAVVRRAVKAFQPHLVGIAIRNVDSLNFLEPAVYTPLAVEVADWAREECHDVRIVLGGAGFTTVPEDLMDFVGADYGLLGFAETSFVALLAAIEEGRRTDTIDGVIQARPEGGYERREPVFQIDYSEVVETDRSFYDRRYFEYTFETHDALEKVAATLQTKKGCVLECIFCSNHLIDGTGVQRNEVRRLVDEVERIVDEGYDSFEIVDGVFNLPLHFALAFLEEMIRRQVRLPWSSMINPGAVNRELVEMMKETGCRHVEFGTDSGSDRILAGLKKNFRQRQIFAAHRLFREVGIKAMHCAFIGSPGDDRESVFETFEVMDQLVPSDCDDSRVYWTLGLRICRGTTLHRMAVDEGRLNGDERFLVPKYYISDAVLRDPQLLDDIQARVLENENWYLWWGLRNISLRQRIRQAQEENRQIEQMILATIEQRRQAPPSTPLVQIGRGAA